MPQQRGPFVLQHAGALNFATLDYNFNGSVSSDMDGISDLEVGIDALLPDLVDFVMEPSDPTPDVDVDGLLVAIDTGLFPALVSSANDLDVGIADANSMLGNAIAFAPSAAWTDSPAPFVPSFDGLPLLPVTIAPGAFNPGTVSPVGQPTTPPSTTPTPAKPTVNLLNLTNYGNPNFTVADQFRLTVTGPAGAAVSASAQQNGTDLGRTSFGSIPGNGQLIIEGTIAPDQVGAWEEQWSVAGQFVTSINFIVVPSGSYKSA